MGRRCGVFCTTFLMGQCAPRCPSALRHLVAPHTSLQGYTRHDGRRCLRWVLKKVPSPCAVLADPAKLSRRRSRLGLRMRLGASRTCRRPAPSGHPPRLPSARPRRAAHPLPRCARSRHGRRPPRSPPLRVAGAQPRAGHLRIHHGEANGPKMEGAPLPGGRRVHLGSACWGGAGAQAHFPGDPEGEEAGRMAATHC